MGAGELAFAPPLARRRGMKQQAFYARLRETADDRGFSQVQQLQLAPLIGDGGKSGNQLERFPSYRYKKHLPGLTESSSGLWRPCRASVAHGARSLAERDTPGATPCPARFAADWDSATAGAPSSSPRRVDNNSTGLTKLKGQTTGAITILLEFDANNSLTITWQKGETDRFVTASKLTGALQAIAYRFFEHGLVPCPPLGCNVFRKLDVGDGQANRHWAGGICFSLFHQRLENVGIRPPQWRGKRGA